MNESFEDQLRRALRPVDAPQGFADRLVAALPPRRAAVTPLVVVPPPTPARAQRTPWLPAALAASLIAAVFFGQQVAHQRDLLAERRAAEAGRAASAQLMQALRITNEKLDIAYEAMNEPRDQDAQENRS
jgi:hypothetical protein